VAGPHQPGRPTITSFFKPQPIKKLMDIVTHPQRPVRRELRQISSIRILVIMSLLYPTIILAAAKHGTGEIPVAELTPVEPREIHGIVDVHGSSR